MIAVAIIGVLASVAIPSYMMFVMKARSSEGIMGLGDMYKGAVAYYYSERSPGQGLTSSNGSNCLITVADGLDPDAPMAPPLPVVPYKRTYDFMQHEIFRALSFSRADGT